MRREDEDPDTPPATDDPTIGPVVRWLSRGERVRRSERTTVIATKDFVEDLKPLTSLRFFAAFAIVLLHAKLYTQWIWLLPISLPLVQGVSFFFVLSGFILTHVYSARRTMGYWRFIRLRLARLWPLHVLTLAVVAAFIHPSSFDGSGFFSRTFTLIANLTLSHSLFPFTAFQYGWNSVSWSISAEMFFYLAFPFLLASFRRYWFLHLLLCAGVLSGSCWLMQQTGVPLTTDSPYQFAISSAIYTHPLARGFEFCLGMAAYRFWELYVRPSQSHWLPWTCLEIATLIGASVWLSRYYWYVSSLLPSSWLLWWMGTSGSCWIFAVVIVVLAEGRGLVGRALCARPFVWLGEISFSIYMVHQLLFKLLVWRLGITSELVLFPVILLLAAVAHYLIERPGQTLIAGSRRTAMPREHSSIGVPEERLTALKPRRTRFLRGVRTAAASLQSRHRPP